MADNNLAGALASAKSLTAQLKQFESLEVYGDLMRAASALQEHLSEALIANATGAMERVELIERAHRLSKENEELKDWAATERDYALTNLGHGAFAYVFQPQVESSKPPHWLCTNCFQKRETSILQAKFRVGYVCPRCKLELEQHRLGDRKP